jgi:hypothetical protein
MSERQNSIKVWCWDPELCFLGPNARSTLCYLSEPGGNTVYLTGLLQEKNDLLCQMPGIVPMSGLIFLSTFKLQGLCN